MAGAEAQGKDFGLIAVEKGYNVYVCGNGGASPKHAVLLASNVPEHKIIKYLDRFLMYYISTADKLQRTARWLEKLEGGIEFLKQVVVEDKLGVGEELERQMQELVDSYFWYCSYLCLYVKANKGPILFQSEWTEVVRNPARRAQFRQFVNTDERQEAIGSMTERGQSRPADWPPDGTPSLEIVAPPLSIDNFMPSTKEVLATTSAEPVTMPYPPEREPPNKFSWHASGMRWVRVGGIENFPVNAGAAVKIGDVQLAVFRVANESEKEDDWYATQNVSFSLCVTLTQQVIPPLFAVSTSDSNFMA